MMPTTYALQQLEVQEKTSGRKTATIIVEKEHLFLAETIDFLPLCVR